MKNIKDEIVKTFGKRLRVRVNGLYIEDGKILLIRHKSLGPSGIFWSPPGGGMEFGESAEANLQREFLEETGLTVKVEKFLFVHEFLDVPLHAVELFFSVKKIGGEMALGADPEMTRANQIIAEVKMLDFEEIKKMPADNVHQVFQLCDNVNDLMNLSGYLRLY